MLGLTSSYTSLLICSMIGFQVEESLMNVTLKGGVDTHQTLLNLAPVLQTVVSLSAFV